MALLSRLASALQTGTRVTAAAIAATFLAAGGAHASILFADWQYDGDPITASVEIQQFAPNSFGFTIDSDPFARVSRFYFDFGGAALSAGDITMTGTSSDRTFSLSTNQTFTQFASEGPFDYLMNFGVGAVNTAAVPITFTINAVGTLADFTKVAMFFQSIAPDGQGSAQALSTTPIPLPAPALLLMAGIAGLGFAARRRKGAAVA